MIRANFCQGSHYVAVEPGLIENNEVCTTMVSCSKQKCVHLIESDEPISENEEEKVLYFLLRNSLLISAPIRAKSLSRKHSRI